MRGEAHALEVGKGSIAHCIEHAAAMGAELLATFAVEVNILLF